MTMALIGINLVVFVLYEILGSTLDTLFMVEHGAMFTPYMMQREQWYRFFTSLFLHFGIQHLLNNMLILFVMGNYLEPLIGRVKFVILYITAGVGANVLSWYLEMRSGEYVASAGASGAIFAALGGLVWVLIRNRGVVGDMTTGKLLFVAVLSLCFGFTSTGVDNAAHLGGLLMGFLLSVILYRKKDSKT